jgi:hypothetical protein
VTKGTDVLIEGFPRSANSFSVAAFAMPQRRPMVIAHHTHAPGHVIRAIQLGVPAIVLIREPRDSILEYLLLRPTLEVADVMRGYERFYRCLLPYRGRFVVGPFPEVTTDFGAVMRRLNERFGTSFVPFEHTAENQAACFDAMDAYWRGRLGEGEAMEMKVGRPSPLREERKRSLQAAFDARAHDRLRERVYAVHAAITANPVARRIDIPVEGA